MGKDFKMETVFGVPVINILWVIVAGKRFQSEDPAVQRNMTLLNQLFKSKVSSGQMRLLSIPCSWSGKAVL